MEFISSVLNESWQLLKASSIYIIFGILVAGILRAFLRPETIATHLGTGRFLPVLKAALFGIPIPMCSCGVIPAAASLKRQGANNGATMAFLISTPESGVDSIAITYALIDPLMTIFRPVAAFITAAAAGITENLFGRYEAGPATLPDMSCPIDNCCDGTTCCAEDHAAHHSRSEKIAFGMRYAFTELWEDLAVWFLAGIILAGLISALIPESLMSQYLGGGLWSMIIMLFAGIPMYICATASTPIAAALILKGVSPGAALVFLLAGPATNIASLTMSVKILGKRSTIIYLFIIAVSSILLGIMLDQIYLLAGISAQATAGSAREIIPSWVQTAGGAVLLALSIKPLYSTFLSKILRLKGHDHTGSCSCS
ncbi:MAG TPA: permease [Deltaproteobacteria bacterium]|nr:permease [Deltaproteobacteria bacterium]